MALTALVATASTVAYQDVVEMTGVAGDGPRWLARLESVPQGSIHRPGSGRSAAPITTHTELAVRSGTSLVPLQTAFARPAGGPSRVNRALKGDRVAPTVARAAPVTPQPRSAALKSPPVVGATKSSGAVLGEMAAFIPSHPHLALASADAAAVQARARIEPAPQPVRTARTVPAVKTASAAAVVAAQVEPAMLAPTRAPTRAAVRAPVQATTDVASDLPVIMARAYAPSEETGSNAFSALLRPALPEVVRSAPARPSAPAKPDAAAAPDVPPAAGDNAEVKVAALDPAAQDGTDAEPQARFAIPQTATMPKRRPSIARTGRIVLAKGDHKWADDPLPRSVRSPSQRRCLAAGVYHEARGESVAGQKAVAQVILNRVRNPAYPSTICGVVYQNQHMRNACQFSFACDGLRDRIRSRKHWRTAKSVANDAIDGRFWLPSVGSSTHYHADYVWPRWRRKMKRLTKIGRHIFYRTRRGGWS